MNATGESSERERVEAEPVARPDQPQPFVREKYLGLLRSGLWPGTARAYLGIGRDAWQEIKDSDARLAEETAQAVAAFEMIHVRNLHAKIQEANDWRGSAWWLAQRFPHRYGGGRESKEVDKAVENVIGLLDEALRAEFSEPAEFGRVAHVLAKLRLGRSG
jgi:hypothetical protein